MERVNVEVLIQTVEKDKKLSDCAKSALLTALNRLADLEDKIENGTLVPCKVGDEMWILNDPYFVAEIFSMRVEEIVIRSDEVYLCGYHEEASEYFECRISFAFKTKEEAEKRLEELRK